MSRGWTPAPTAACASSVRSSPPAESKSDDPASLGVLVIPCVAAAPALPVELPSEELLGAYPSILPLSARLSR